jgi:hypothetical protein
MSNFGKQSQNKQLMHLTNNSKLFGGISKALSSQKMFFLAGISYHNLVYD